MDAHRFRNILVSLMNIDLHELVEAGVIAEGNLDNGGSSWSRFNDQPLIFVAKLGDQQLEALWRLVEARQKPDQYVVWSNEHSAWWGANRAGYYTSLDSAGRYTRDEAVAICKNARGGREFNRNPSEVPLPLSDAEEFWTDHGLEEQRRHEQDRIRREIERSEAEADLS